MFSLGADSQDTAGITSTHFMLVADQMMMSYETKQSRGWNVCMPHEAITVRPAVDRKAC